MHKERCDAVAKRQDAQHQRGVDTREDVQDARVAGPALHTAHAASNLFYAAPRLISNLQRLDAPARDSGRPRQTASAGCPRHPSIL
jgi:hypothetical protein